MVAIGEIEEFGHRIGREFEAERVILFGSYAQGAAVEYSDVDLLVVAETDLAAHERYGAVRRLVADAPASFDIIVKTPTQILRFNRFHIAVVKFDPVGLG